MTQAGTAPDARHGPGGPLFWVTATIGAGVVIGAIVNLVRVTPHHALGNVAAFVGGSGIVHDALWAPAAVILGLATRALPHWARVPVRIGLAFSALLVLVTWPETRRYGAKPANPSIVPLDYTRNLVLVLCGTWAMVAGAVAVRWLRARS